jgi:hypothetical protein
MALQLGALRDALIEAGASADKAEKAAEEGAAYETRLSGIEADLRVLKWMVGTLYPLVLAILLKLFIP